MDAGFYFSLAEDMAGLFHCRMEGHGKLETQKQISTRIIILLHHNLLSMECFPCNPVEESDFHQQHHMRETH